MATPLEALQKQQPDAADLLRRSAGIAIAQTMQDSQYPIRTVSYDMLDANVEDVLGLKLSGVVDDAFRVAVRQDPSCHGPYLADKVIVGTFPEPGTDPFNPTVVAYTKMLSTSLGTFWPTGHSPIASQATTEHWLQTAHQTAEGDIFHLSHLPTFFERITSGKNPAFVSLAPGYVDDSVVNLSRFGKSANIHTSKIPVEQRHALVEQAVAALSAKHTSIVPQLLIHEIATIRNEPVHRWQVGLLIARALQMDGVTLQPSDIGEKIAFANPAANQAKSETPEKPRRT